MNAPLFSQASKIHFVGIKGVGMTALALCAQDLGIIVEGSDVVADFVTSEVLKQRNLTTIVGFDITGLSAGVDLVVYSGANEGVNNPVVKEAKNRGIRIISHAEAVGEVMRGKIGISVCGVGGKTSTAAMLTNILEYGNLMPSFMIGVGKVLNLQVPGRISGGKHMVVEADEYAISPGSDNSPRFGFQQPKIIICTNVNYDHPDVYNSIQSTKLAFGQFFGNLPSDGVLIGNGDSIYLREIASKVRTIFFGVEPTNDWYVKDSFIGQGRQLITVVHNQESFNFSLSVPGIFNAKNALSAYIASRELGVSHQIAVEGLQLFRGSKRRFEKVGERGGVLYYDDYAHHPIEIAATLKAAKEWLPLYKVVAVFQPHTYSRTKALFNEFALSFKDADVVVITDIYGAREDEDATINGQMLADEIKKFHKEVMYVSRAELGGFLKTTLKVYDALFTLGAGDIYKLHQDLSE